LNQRRGVEQRRTAMVTSLILFSTPLHYGHFFLLVRHR
jgi:hypothetical protein